MNRIEDGRIEALSTVQIAPRDGLLGAYGDDGIVLYGHRLVLVVLAPQEPYGGGVLLRARLQELGPAAHHHERQEVPVLGVAVGDQGHLRVLDDVPNAFEIGNGYVFRLLVEGYVDRSSRKSEAYWHGVRLPRRVGGGEASDPLAYEEGCLLLTQYVRGHPQVDSASRTLGATSEAKRRILSSACSWVIPGRRAQGLSLLDLLQPLGVEPRVVPERQPLPEVVPESERRSVTGQEPPQRVPARLVYTHARSARISSRSSARPR